MKKSGSRSDEAYQQIKLMLLRDQLQPGQKLRYQDIAKRVGMSQTPVMLALVRLENEGLVRSRPNRGYYVPEIDLEEAKELYDIRLMIEVPLLEGTVASISDQQITELEEMLEAHAAVREGTYSRERIWRDAKFHLALAACSGHRMAMNILRRVFDLLYLRYRPPVATPERVSTTEREHREFFAALSARQPERCMAVMRDHIEHGRQFILESLPSRGEPQEALRLLDE